MNTYDSLDMIVKRPDLEPCATEFPFAILSVDDCSGTMIFSWHMENDDVTSGIPAGCSQDADKTVEWATGAALSATQASDGSQSMYRSGSNGAAYFLATGASKTDCYMSFKLWIVSYPSAASTYVVSLTDAGINDYFAIKLTSASTVTATFCHNGTARVATASNPGTGSWLTGTCLFRTSSSPYIYLTIGAQTAQGVVAPSAMTDTPTIIMIGGEDGSTGYFYLDNLKIYNVAVP